MDATEFEQLLVGLRDGRVHVRVGVERPAGSSNQAVASLLARRRLERIARGDRVAYVYKSPEDGDDDYSIETAIDAEQARLLLAAGAVELGAEKRAPAPNRTQKFLAHLQRVRGTAGTLSCPVCGTHKWSIEGLVALSVAPVFVKPASSDLPAAPFLQVVCTTCYYVMHFAWNPIERDSSENLKAGAIRAGTKKEPER